MTLPQIRSLTRHHGWTFALPGVLLAPGFLTSWEQGLLMLSFWGGPGLALSHRSAAAKWGFEGFSPGILEVTTRKDRRPLPGEITVHRMQPVNSQVTEVDGLRTTGRLFTLLQLGAVAEEEAVRRAADKELAERRITLPGLAWILATYGKKGFPGTAVLRQICEELGPGYRPPESQLEPDYRALVKAWGIEEPEYQVWMRGPSGWMRLDGLYRRIGLDVELDGRSTHERQAQFQADRERDRFLLTQGIHVVRYTWHDVHHQQARMEAEHRRLLARQQRSQLLS